MLDPLEPNDLSHLGDEEFNALCPIGHHAPGPEPLSPAAQAVLDAVTEICPAPADEIAAATLRAAVEQEVPYDPKEAMHFTTEAIRLNRMSVRASFLAIAAELDGHQ